MNDRYYDEESKRADAGVDSIHDLEEEFEEYVESEFESEDPNDAPHPALMCDIIRKRSRESKGDFSISGMTPTLWGEFESALDSFVPRKDIAEVLLTAPRQWVEYEDLSVTFSPKHLIQRQDGKESFDPEALKMREGHLRLTERSSEGTVELENALPWYMAITNTTV